MFETQKNNHRKSKEVGGKSSTGSRQSALGIPPNIRRPGGSSPWTYQVQPRNLLGSAPEPIRLPEGTERDREARRR